MVGALPTLPYAEHRWVFLVEHVRPGGHPGVRTGLALQLADGEHEGHAGVGPGDGHRLALPGGAQRDAG